MHLGELGLHGTFCAARRSMTIVPGRSRVSLLAATNNHRVCHIHHLLILIQYCSVGASIGQKTINRSKIIVSLVIIVRRKPSYRVTARGWI